MAAAAITADAEAPAPKKGPSIVVQAVLLLVLTGAAAGGGWFSGGMLKGEVPPPPAADASADASAAAGADAGGGHGAPAAGGHGESSGGHGEKAGGGHGEAAGGHGDAAAEGGHGAAPGGATTTLFNLAPITTNLAAPSDIWARMEVTVQFDVPPTDPTIVDMIHQDLLSFMRTVKMHQIEGASGILHLKADLEDRASVRSDGHVKHVFIRTLLFE